MAFIIRKRDKSATIMRRREVPVTDALDKRIGFTYETTVLGSIPLDAEVLPGSFASSMVEAGGLTAAEQGALESKLFAPARQARIANQRAREEEEADPLRRLAQALALVEDAARLSVSRPIPLEDLVRLEVALQGLMTQGARDWLGEVSKLMSRARVHFECDLAVRGDDVSFTDNPVAEGWASVGAEHTALRATLQARRWVRSKESGKLNKVG